MDVLSIKKKWMLGILFVSWFNQSAKACELCYYLKAGYSQAQLLSRRVSIEKTFHNPKIPEETKRKIRLMQEAKKFAEAELGLKPTKNYTTYVQLDQPYVSYVVNASEMFTVKDYLWDYWVVGKMPYKGFTKESEAKKEAEALQAKGFDTFVRGVSAYSTLGWFEDPILSSMMDYSDFEIVNTIIHESVHATLYIKNSADFNEQLANFLGEKGAHKFFQKKEGETSATVKQAEEEHQDSVLFAKFLTQQILALNEKYKTLNEEMTLKKKTDLKTAWLKEIQNDFTKELLPKLKTKSYLDFPKKDLNNAYLALYKTYLHDFSDFEKCFQHFGGDTTKMLEFLKRLEDSPPPVEEAFRSLVSKLLIPQ